MTDAAVAELPTTPGARLRHERERRGMSAQQVAEMMNLDAAVIEALENDDFASLGAPVFAKGHLRKYAALLALPDRELIDAYEHSNAQPSQPTLVPRARIEMQPERRQRRWPWAVGSLAVFLVAAAIIAWVSNGTPGLPWRASDSTATATDAVPATSSSAPPSGAVPGNLPAGAPQPASGAAGDTAQFAPAGTTGVIGSTATPGAARGAVALQFKFSADSWVEVYDASGKAVLYDLGREGSDRVVSGQPPLSVTLGNAPVVSLAIDGRAVSVPTPPDGTVVRFSVAPDGSIR